ncbi:helix-turn-helix domain-containing protein [Deinococcus sp. HMF7620]|uniref:Helix-turn-helix domain-containing protein n=1 Tax=Deinococcus arboris TaxID=2682977 RepID=A0A7C9I2V5_9DEIO|nr:helix-turn-helix domain-containing protein [Deinococcus arboris]MVN86851.1 helix-turn-helix domain-containing protein [Deinococcus arboris]
MTPASQPLFHLTVADLEALLDRKLAGHTETVMTTDQVAALLATSESTVLRLVRAGKIPARKLGQEYRYYRSEVLASLPSTVQTPITDTAEPSVQQTGQRAG